MHLGSRGATVAAMAQSDHDHRHGPHPPGGGDGRLQVVVVLGADSDGRPVGSVQPEGGTPLGFTGWLALMAELSRLMPGPAKKAAAPAGPLAPDHEPADQPNATRYR